MSDTLATVAPILGAGEWSSMAERERRLGKGLETLISAAREKSLTLEVASRLGHRIQSIPIDQIQPNPFQPRREFPVEALNALVESLRVHGLMQPLVVRRQDARFQLIAGERRWRAAQELGWPQIDAIVVTADDQRMVEWALIENVQRQDLNAIELAAGLRRMHLEFGMTQEEIARRIGQSRSAIANTLRLLDLPESIQTRVSRGTLAPGAARALLGIAEAALQEALADRIERDAASVRQAESWAREAKEDRGPAPPRLRLKDPNVQALAESLARTLGAKVSIHGTHDRGRIVLDYFSARELDHFARLLQGIASQVPDASCARDAADEEEVEEDGGFIAV